MLDKNDIVSADQADSEETPLLGTSTSRMAEKNMGISQQILVSEAGVGNITAAKKLPQYMAGIAATLGALAFGLILAWTNSAGKDGVNLASEYGISISSEEFSWISSMVTLGAGAVCVPIGILADFIGRKKAMLVLVVPFIIGWLLIIFANSVIMLYIGRFVLGLAGGAFCVTAPIYTAEIAETKIRGTLGSYFQLMLVIGILGAYVLGPQLSIKHFSIISSTVPIVFFCIFFFMPETPTFYLQKGMEDEARANLVRLRGPYYNVEPEIQAQQEAIAEAERNSISFREAMQTRAAKRAMLIGLGLMFFQQFCGINTIIFYASQIFDKSGGIISTEWATIVVGLIQVVAVFISTLVIDRLGRRILLFASEAAMCLTTLVLGIYFYLQEQKSEIVASLSVLPIICICVFIFLFSLGFGPIPWMMMGEIFPSNIRKVAGSSVCLFNWLMAFLVTKFFSTLQERINIFGCFWLFSGICAVGLFFIFFCVPETKGKTLEEIQFELGGQGPDRKNTTNPVH